MQWQVWEKAKVTILFWSQTGTPKLICQSALFGLKFSLYGQKYKDIFTAHAQKLA